MTPSAGDCFLILPLIDLSCRRTFELQLLIYFSTYDIQLGIKMTVMFGASRWCDDAMNPLLQSFAKGCSIGRDMSPTLRLKVPWSHEAINHRWQLRIWMQMAFIEGKMIIGKESAAIQDLQGQRMNDQRARLLAPKIFASN